MSLVILDKLLFGCRSRNLLEKWIKQYQFGHIRQIEICRKKLVEDGADKVESLLITDNTTSNVLSFLKESTRLLKLHIDGADFYANCKG